MQIDDFMSVEIIGLEHWEDTRPFPSLGENEAVQQLGPVKIQTGAVRK